MQSVKTVSSWWKQPLQLDWIALFNSVYNLLNEYVTPNRYCGTLIEVNRQLRERDVEASVKQTWYWASVEEKKTWQQTEFLSLFTSQTDTQWDTGPESQSRRLKVGRSWEVSHVVPEAVCACVWVLYVLYVSEFSISESGGVSLRNCFWNNCLCNLWINALFSLWFPCSRCAYSTSMWGVP